MDLREGFVQVLRDRGKVEVAYIGTEYNVADLIATDEGTQLGHNKSRHKFLVKLTQSASCRRGEEY